MSDTTIYDGTDLIRAMQVKVAELEKGLNDLKSGGIALAEAEKQYKIMLTKSALSLKQQGYTATMLDKILYGLEDVAELRYERDVANAIYEARKERVNATKLEIRILENQISREYGKGGGL